MSTSPTRQYCRSRRKGNVSEFGKVGAVGSYANSRENYQHWVAQLKFTRSGPKFWAFLQFVHKSQYLRFKLAVLLQLCHSREYTRG